MIQDTRLGDLCEFINGGAWSDKEYVMDGIPVLKVSNFKPTGFILEDVSFLPESSLEKYKKNLLLTGDLVIATVGSHPNLLNSAAGKSCIVTNEVNGYLLNQNAVCVRTLESEILDQRFLCYLARSYYFQHYIQSCGRGAANQMRIAIGAIKDYKFDLPDITIQRRIAEILSAYDDLIENNQKQIKLIEETAMRMYKEWFVHLHFPGYECTEIVDNIPIEWHIQNIESLLSYEIGGGWGEDNSSKEFSIKAWVIRGTDIDGISAGEIRSIPCRYHKESNFSARNLQPGDIIFEVSGGSKNYGVAKSLLISEALLNQLIDPVICASFCKMMRPANLEQSNYLFQTLQYLRETHQTERFEKRSASSIINYRWKDFLTQQYILVPNNTILQQYNELALPMHELKYKLSSRIEILKVLKNAILSKLISGEIEV